MKTYCKHSRITEPAFVRDCIERFLKGKRSRRDVNEFLSRHPDLDSLSRQIADEIGRGEYRFAPIIVPREGRQMADGEHPRQGHSRRASRDQTMGARTIQQSVRETGRAQMLSKHQP